MPKGKKSDNQPDLGRWLCHASSSAQEDSPQDAPMEEARPDEDDGVTAQTCQASASNQEAVPEMSPATKSQKPLIGYNDIADARTRLLTASQKVQHIEQTSEMFVRYSFPPSGSKNRRLNYDWLEKYP